MFEIIWKSETDEGRSHSSITRTGEVAPAPCFRPVATMSDQMLVAVGGVTWMLYS